MNRFWQIVAVLGFVTFLAGCGTMSRPKWFAPGPAKEQQARAERFDPYPSKDIGPSVVGTRPREFAQPYAEPLRNQWEQWGPGRAQANAAR